MQELIYMLSPIRDLLSALSLLTKKANKFADHKVYSAERLIAPLSDTSVKSLSDESVKSLFSV